MSNIKKKFLILGANGLIGKSVAQELNPKYDWQGTYYSRSLQGYLRCDITSKENLDRIFDLVKPSHVVHCANLAGGLDFCEDNPELAKKFHYDGTVNIAKHCLDYGARLIFISTECVFNGKKEFYDEDDKPDPISMYGAFKAKSEEWLSSNFKDYVIVRTMSVYGWDPLTVTPNAVMKLYNSISNIEMVYAPTFRWCNPTFSPDLAKAILELSLSEETGIFNVVGSTYINRYEWLKKTCEVLGWDAYLVKPQEKPNYADNLRPERIKLNTEKFKNKFLTELHNLTEGLNLLKCDMEEKEYLDNLERDKNL